jgi:hypothetical protein
VTQHACHDGCRKEIVIHMSRRKMFRLYLTGMSATLAGAWVTELTGSMLPLALGAAFTLMCTARVVHAVWTRKRM